MKNLSQFIFVLLIPIMGYAQFIGTGQSMHTIVAKSNGKVYTWGSNYYGQLGNGTTTKSNIPVAVNANGVLVGRTITRVAGSDHSIALASDGTVYTWGDNSSGQLGNGTNTNSNIPVAVNTSGVLNGKTIIQVAAGLNHSIALASDGKVYAWGANNWGQLGNGGVLDSNIPVAVNSSGILSGKTIIQIASGLNHSIALASDGTVYTWGYNSYSQLGNGHTGTASAIPVAVVTSGVLSGKTIIQIAGGGDHSIALASDGTVYTWGYNIRGQLGNGNSVQSNVPVAVVTSGVLSGKTIRGIAGGDMHSIVLASDGTVYTWGANFYGQLGNGYNTDSYVPVTVDTIGVLNQKTIIKVAAGSYHSIALDNNYMIYTWGRNSGGQLGIGNYTTSSFPVAVDQSFIGPLPVELSSFTAAINGNKVVLKWQTITEKNNYGFEIERSAGSVSDSLSMSKQILVSRWLKIGYVKGAGTATERQNYFFTDENVPDGKYLYRMKQIDFDGSFIYSNEIEVDVNFLNHFALEQNYPNPFNPSTKIKFTIPAVETLRTSTSLSNHATSLQTLLKIYDILGREVATLVNEEKEPGVYEVEFHGVETLRTSTALSNRATSLQSGVYFYQLRIGDFTETRKMILLR